MTPNEQRITIATACGWKNCRCDVGGNVPLGEPDDDFNRDVEEHKSHGQCGFPTTPHRKELPDYLNDLNAMHEAEAVAYKNNCSFLAAYKGVLCFVTGSDCPFFATASQRSEAFLRTLNLWKE